MTGLVIVGAIAKASRPGALFADATSLDVFAPERSRYEAAVQTFAREASPAALREHVAALRRYGIRATQADVRETAIDALRVELQALGYKENEIQWHAARRGRRDQHLFAANMEALASVINESPQTGRWRGPYSKRHH